ncbi:MAG: hypothetical protein MHM6MM_004373, partial [Cercozoa sp. M6MM]
SAVRYLWSECPEILEKFEVVCGHLAGIVAIISRRCANIPEISFVTAAFALADRYDREQAAAAAREQADQQQPKLDLGDHWLAATYDWSDMLRLLRGSHRFAPLETITASQILSVFFTKMSHETEAPAEVPADAIECIRLLPELVGDTEPSIFVGGFYQYTDFTLTPALVQALPTLQAVLNTHAVSTKRSRLNVLHHVQSSLWIIIEDLKRLAQDPRRLNSDDSKEDSDSDEDRSSDQRFNTTAKEHRIFLVHTLLRYLTKFNEEVPLEEDGEWSQLEGEQRDSVNECCDIMSALHVYFDSLLRARLQRVLDSLLPEHIMPDVQGVISSFVPLDGLNFLFDDDLQQNMQRYLMRHLFYKLLSPCSSLKVCDFSRATRRPFKRRQRLHAQPSVLRIPNCQMSYSVDHEIAELVRFIKKLSTDASQPQCTFKQLFEDDECANTLESLAGTLKAAKRRGVVAYGPELLLQGMSDNVVITLNEQ